MVSGTRLFFLFLIVVSVFCIVTCKRRHKKSHGPLRPGASKTGHGKGHVPKQHHHHAKKTHIHHHLKFKHHHKHRHEPSPHLKAHSEHHHHHQPAVHLKAHSKHKYQHAHQPALHLKGHKKGITFAKSPAEPQACVDFLPCLQYRYYHCRFHEWIRNNCPKLCLYCEHQPFPEPMYGRFKTVAASYPDWCLDHSQCVAYPTEACQNDEWMRLNCLRKCDTCYKYKKVKAGLVFVGPPFDKTLEQKKEEHQLNKILQFRPTPPPPTKAKNSKLKSKGKLAADVAKGTAQGPAVAIKDTPVPAAKPATDSLQASSPAANMPVKPASPEKPGLPLTPNSPVVQQQNLAAGKLETKPEPQPEVVNLPTVTLRPKTKTPVGVPGYSYQDLVHQELEAARDAPSTKQFKAEVLKQVQIKLKTSGFPQINTAKVFAKHKVSKPRRKHMVESQKKGHMKHKIAHKKNTKHVQKKEKVAAKNEELHKTKTAKEEKHNVKVVNKEKNKKKEKKEKKEVKEKKIAKKVEKKSKSHHKSH